MGASLYEKKGMLSKPPVFRVRQTRDPRECKMGYTAWMNLKRIEGYVLKNHRWVKADKKRK